MVKARADFFIDQGLSARQMAERVRADGLAVVPAYVQGSGLSTILAEFQRAYEPEYAAIFHHDHVDCHNLRVSRPRWLKRIGERIGLAARQHS